MGGKSLNHGHRERMRQKFISAGFDGFHDHEVLEMLLFYSISRKNTNDIAHKLLDHFGGSLSAVFDAPYEELKKVDGVGDTTAALISMMPSLFRRYRESAQSGITTLSSTKVAGKYLVSKFIGRRNETVMMICLDNACRVLNCQILSEGSVVSASINTRRIVEIAMKFNAYGVIISHNHPGGVPLPSRDDIITTNSITRALDSIDIELIDHIIVAGEEFISMADNKMIKKNT